jgi:hypothetical protein
MTTTRLLAIGLGAGLLLGSGAAVAQSQDDDRQSSPTDAVTKPLGEASGQAGSTGDRSTQSGSPLGASGSNPAQQNLSFGVLDINTDGKLSKDEVKGNATLTSDFSKLDTDRNGSLSNGEFAAFETKGKASGTEGGAKGGSSGAKAGGKSKEKDTNRSAPSEQAGDKAKRAGDKAEEETQETMD